MLAAWLVHLYTASGAFFALLAALETVRPHPDPRWFFVWLIIAVLIDATDGPLARRFEVKKRLPHIQGRTIDDIVDYLTFTFLPLLMAERMDWIAEPSLLFIAAALITSLLGFANAGAKNESAGYFLGFPSYWNIVVFYLGVFAAMGGRVINAALVILLAALTVVPVRFIYPNLAPPRWRRSILAGAFAWLALLLAMLPSYPSPPLWLLGLSLLYPLFYAGVSLGTLPAQSESQ